MQASTRSHQYPYYLKSMQLIGFVSITKTHQYLKPPWCTRRHFKEVSSDNSRTKKPSWYVLVSRRLFLFKLTRYFNVPFLNLIVHSSCSQVKIKYHLQNQVAGIFYLSILQFVIKWKSIVEWAHRQVTQVDRTMVYSLEWDRIQSWVMYDNY